MPLLDNITRNTSWKPKLLIVEVGVRGFKFVASNSHQAFLRLGLPRQKVSALSKKLTAAKCSYAIYLAAISKVWDHDRPLLDQHLVPFGTVEIWASWTGKYRHVMLNCIGQGHPPTIGGQALQWFS